MCAAPMTSEPPPADVATPYAFENRTRTVWPPMLVWTIMRSVWLLNETELFACGLVAHVPTQCSSPRPPWARAAGPVMRTAMAKVIAKSMGTHALRTHGDILLVNCLHGYA